MSPLILFWAKLGKAEWPEPYHPVVCHLIDVAAVARAMWEDVFRPGIRRWAAARLGLTEDAAGRWLAFWAGAHDIGKVSPDFQSQGKTNKLKKRLEKEFDFPTGEPKPHGDISTAVLNAELKRGARNWPPVDAPIARNVAIAVGGHYGLFLTNWDPMCGPPGNEKWAEARREILAELTRLFDITDLAPPCPPAKDDQSVWMYLAGLTSVADWIGSNQKFFEPFGRSALTESDLDLDDYYREAIGRARDALEVLGWLGRETATADCTFSDLFEGILTGKARPLQEAAEESARGMTGPSLMLIEAPMGEGKTEAAWYVADVWDRRGGQGAYIALPTMATSNQMFKRVGSFLEANLGKKILMLQHGKAALNDRFEKMLQHGKAALNDRFEKLKYAARVYDDDNHPSAVVAEAWFAANKKHGLLAPYGVGAIDQALFAVLQTRHVFVRLFGLAGKCVILDEVHAYDAYMTTLMERLLGWLAALGCPVVLLSATLPRDKRLQLLRAYAGDNLPEPAEEPYPRVTSVERSGCAGVKAKVKHVAADPDRAQTVHLGWLNEEVLAEKLRQSLANGGCAAVIRNTVGLAQETHRKLKKFFAKEIEGGELRLELFHARFPFGRRKQIEEYVLKWYGRTKDDVIEDARIAFAPHRPTKSILVATQVVEQ